MIFKKNQHVSFGRKPLRDEQDLQKVSNPGTRVCLAYSSAFHDFHEGVCVRSLVFSRV
jgi:hypothetical protein